MICRFLRVKPGGRTIAEAAQSTQSQIKISPVDITEATVETFIAMAEMISAYSRYSLLSSFIKYLGQIISFTSVWLLVECLRLTR